MLQDPELERLDWVPSLLLLLSVQRRRSLREPSLWTCVSWRWPGKSGSYSVPTWTNRAWRLCFPRTAWCWWQWPGPSTGTKPVWASLNRCLVSSGHRWWTTAGRSRMSTWGLKDGMHSKVRWHRRLLWVTVQVNCSFSAVDDMFIGIMDILCWHVWIEPAQAGLLATRFMDLTYSFGSDPFLNARLLLFCRMWLVTIMS